MKEDIYILIQQDKEKAFREILVKYKENIYWQVRKMVLDHDDANDVTQEVFIKLYTGFNSFRFQSSVSTWVYRIAINHCLNFLRTRRRFTSFDEVEAGASQAGHNDMDVKLDLRESLRRLPGATRSLFLLKYVESYTYEEIAKLTGLSESAVKMRISRAKQNLARERTG